MRSNEGTMGCLLIGETARMRTLKNRLDALGVSTLSLGQDGQRLSVAQEGLRAVRGPGGACVAAEGELWAAALALAVQLSVERIVLIAPTDTFAGRRDEQRRQMERLKGYARRNLFFCVSEVLVLEGAGDVRSERRIDQVCRRMCNARVHRAALSGEARQEEGAALDAAARFLAGSLAL